MYKIITKSCKQFNVPRLQRQFSETVNDILYDIFLKLNSENCKALAEFQAVHNEKQFLAWLAIICERTASRVIQRYFKQWMVESAPTDFKTYVKSLPEDSDWMLYEEFVYDMRSSAVSKRKNLERDIHIFMLYKWAQLSQPTLMANPCFKSLGNRVIDVVVNRMLDGLRALNKY